MRRRSAHPLPPWTEIEASLNAAPGEEGWLVRVTLPLRAITPVIGGGTEPREPDEVDIVRLPEVRGLLRWWWRALLQGDQSAEDLFLREAALWGAVDVPDGRKRKAVRSRVRLDVRVREKGTVGRAGIHTLNQRGFAGGARWDQPALGYALFPLQRTESERAGRRTPMDTRSMRTGLAFDLEVSIVEPGPDDVRQVLLAVWAWIRFGGLGARTRRGFGALELVAPPAFSPATPGPSMAFEAGDLEVEWRRLRELVDPAARLGNGARLLLGPESSQASQAHGAAVELLKTFRQQVGTGRRNGQGNRPGHSNWPEADVLRRLAKVVPRDPIPEGDDAAACGAPRAAFGLPLLIKFGERAEEAANATLVPVGGGRWSSPLILRPVRCGAGRYRPLALFLGGEGPERVALENNGTTLQVRTAAGARPPIRGYLDRAGGDALQAFAAWLEASHHFVPVGAGGGRGR